MKISQPHRSGVDDVRRHVETAPESGDHLESEISPSCIVATATVDFPAVPPTLVSRLSGIEENHSPPLAAEAVTQRSIEERSIDTRGPHDTLPFETGGTTVDLASSGDRSETLSFDVNVPADEAHIASRCRCDFGRIR